METGVPVSGCLGSRSSSTVGVFLVSLKVNPVMRREWTGSGETVSGRVTSPPEIYSPSLRPLLPPSPLRYS